MSLERDNFEFGEFLLEVKEKVLLRNGKPVSITPKVFQLLFVLLKNHGHIVTKEELIKIIWADSFVEAGNLTFTIRMLRKLLDDDSNNPKFIETVPRRGYRFIADIKLIPEENNFKNESTAINDLPSISTEHHFIVLPKTIFFRVILFLVIILFSGAFAFWYLKTQNAVPNSFLPFTSEKLSINGKVSHAIVSPDGRTMVYDSGMGNDKESLWLRQLETGENIEIIAPSNDLYAGLAFSPDGNYLYFTRRPIQSEGQMDIYRIPILGGIAQKIIGETQGWISISPDGAKISFVRCYYRADENCSLWVADALDGKNERKIATRQHPFRIGDSKFSPDGKSVAFAVGQSQNQSNEFGLAAVDLETGQERELTDEKFFDIISLAWLPNKNNLLFTASRVPNNKNFHIWQVDFDKNKAVPLTKDSENYTDLSLSKEANKLVATEVRENYHLRIFSAENPSSVRLLTDAGAISFSPDGRILFSSPMSGNDEIWSINPDGSNQKQLTNDPAHESTPIGAPDNNSIYFASNRSGSVQVWQMKADGSNQVQITHNEGGFPIFVSPDGKWIYYIHGITRTLWRVLLVNGEEQMVLNKSKFYLAISPDGSQVAYSEKQDNETILMIVSLTDGKTSKTFHLVERKSQLRNIIWMPDGKNLAYISTNPKSGHNILWRQPLNEDAAHQITVLDDEEMSESISLATSPDGKTFAVVQGGWLHDAVLISGLRFQ